MVVRMSLIGLLAFGVVLFGTGAGAETLRTRPIYQRVTVNVYGCNNVVATDRSVLTVGDHSPVNANAGDVSSGGTLGVATDRSALESGASGRPADNARLARKPSRDRKAQTRRSVAVAGYEDHSVRVAGERQMAVYDDSNLFVNRNGKINGNTGDTDSSGLNAVDVSGSRIRSGDHIEGDENDSDSDKEDVGAAPRGHPAASRRTPPRATSSVTDEGEARANGDGALTIGGDGYDNLGVNVHGRRNIAAYDDSNVVVGGAGDVNAQIGDSDTSGAAVMGVKDSDIRSGNST